MWISWALSKCFLYVLYISVCPDKCKKCTSENKCMTGECDPGYIQDAATGNCHSCENCATGRCSLNAGNAECTECNSGTCLFIGGYCKPFSWIISVKYCIDHLTVYFLLSQGMTLWKDPVVPLYAYKNHIHLKSVENS